MNREQIYFDNAATTLPKPQEVKDAVLYALDQMGNSGRGVHKVTLSASMMIYETREMLADLFHAEDPSRIAFTMNATESLNTAIYGLFQSGDHVITTQAEHNSVLRPLYDLEEKGLELTTIPCDRKGIYSYEMMEEAIRENTKAIVCCHASNLTGNLYDIKRIGDIAQRHGILLIVDAAQTAGVMPIDVQEMKIDVLCFTGHKGLWGPQGTGGIYVRPGLMIRPLKQGGSGVQTYLRHHPSEMPTALEAGTLNGHGIAGLHGALDYLNRTGMETIREKEQQLMWRVYQGLSEIPKVTVYGDFSEEEDGTKMLRCPIVAFNIEGEDSGIVGDVLAYEYGIALRTGAHCAPRMHEALGTTRTGAVRISLSHCNTEQEVDTLLRAVREMIEE